jgi:hypothetical protein
VEDADGYIARDRRVMIPCPCGIWIKKELSLGLPPFRIGDKFKHHHVTPMSKRFPLERCPDLLVTVSRIPYQENWCAVTKGFKYLTPDYASFALSPGREEALTR